ncbi:MAG TPA: hypothetical protein VI565_03365 [Burkholderiales bacterium]|nr:hypothetical protein [Burkholderiales bacterium]
MNVVAHQRGIHLSEIAIGAAGKKNEGRQSETPAAPNLRAHVKRRSIHFLAQGRSGSARDTAAAAAARTVTAVRFETVGPVRTAVDADHRQNDDGRRFGGGVDISAAARIAGFIGKLDDFAHCSPLFRSGAYSPHLLHDLIPKIGSPLLGIMHSDTPDRQVQLKGLQG